MIFNRRLRNGLSNIKVTLLPRTSVRGLFTLALFLSGAKTSDMKHCIVPTFSTPPDEIVQHIGTNDIIHSSAQQIIQNISEIGDIITEASSEIKVTISNIITRSDNVNLHQKIDGR